MALDVGIAPKTYQDLLALPEDSLRHELLEGEHFVTPSPVVRHQRVVTRLTLSIGVFVEEHDLGEVWGCSVDVVMSETNVLVPDLVYVSRERSGRVGEKNITGAPDLVIEVLSPSTGRRDRGVKRSIYERFGVREYWIVDPERCQVTVFRAQGDDGFAEPEVISAGRSSLSTPLLPDWSMELERLFR